MKKVSKRVFAYVLVISLFFSNDYFNVFAKEIKKEGINKEKIEETISENMIDIETDSENEISELGNDSEDEFKPELPVNDKIDTDKGQITWSIDKNGLLKVEGKGQPTLKKEKIQYKVETGAGYERYSYYVDECWPWATYQNVIKSVEINLSDFTTCKNMFLECPHLEKVTFVKEFDTSKVQNMRCMFSGCSSLTELDLSNFDTSNVTYMYNMFSKCSSLTKLDLSNFDTSKVQDMENMFLGCSSLTKLDLSNFNTSKVQNMRCMFSGCSSLTELYLSNFDTSNITKMSGMFSGCSSLTKLYLSNFDTSNVEYMDDMFLGCSSLTELYLSNFDTSNVKYMDYMFSKCSSLTKLYLSNFDTSNVYNMGYMFSECLSLTELDLSSFDTSNVEYMRNMFSGCSSLTELYLSNFDTSNVYNMAYMFSKCSSLTELDLSNFDTSKLQDMAHMFSGCSSLTELDLSSFDTSNVECIRNMFSGCSSLTELDLSNFDISNVKYMEYMFSECSSLTELDLSNFDTSNVISMYNMFYNNGLKLIISPINLPAQIRISYNDKDKWIDENGNIVESIPNGLKTPIAIQKNVEDAPEPYKKISVKTIVSEGNGKITPGNCSYDFRFHKNFKFIPDKGYCVNKVIIDGENKGSISSYEFTSENSKSDTHTIEVYFIKQKYTVNIKNEKYVKITGNLNAVINEDILLSFKAEDGYRITDVLVDGKSVGVVDSYKFEKITQNHEIEFKVSKEKLIKVICGENGKISPNGNSKVLEGESIKYTIIPDEKYIIKDVLVDEKSIGAVREYTFENVTTNHSIEASFIKNVFNVSFNVNGKNIDDFSKEFINGSKYGKLPTVSEIGIVDIGFLGWYTAKNGGNKITEETVVSLTNDITLYAHFEYISIVEKQKLNIKKYFPDVENIKSYKVIKLSKGKASVSKKGVLKAKKAGMIKIVPCVKEGKKKVQLEDKAITIIITKPKFNTKSITGRVGETKKINSLITGLPANSNEITYTIKANKNPEKQVAKVNEETGNIELLKKGKTKLTVRIINEDKSERKLSIKIIVK